MTTDDDVLLNFKSCFYGLVINAESNFKSGREGNLVKNLDFFAQKDINEGYSNRTLQILQSEHRKGNKHFLRAFRGELEEIQNRIEKIQSDNKGNFLLNQFSISMDGFTTVWGFLVEAFTIYLVRGGKKQVSEWEFLNRTGMQEELAKMGFNMNPVHDVRLLVPHREKNFEKIKIDFLEERKIKKVIVTDLDLNYLKFYWLESELKTIKEWHGHYTNGKQRLTYSDQIEVEKYKRFVEREIVRIECETNADPVVQDKTEGGEDTSGENDFLLSTIEDYLEPFKDQKVLVNDNYSRLVKVILEYVETGVFPTDIELIKVGRTNKKSFGWAINRILNSKGKSIDYELLCFAKQKISLYSGYDLNKADFRRGNLYKYFTTKTK